MQCIAVTGYFSIYYIILSLPPAQKLGRPRTSLETTASFGSVGVGDTVWKGLGLNHRRAIRRFICTVKPHRQWAPTAHNANF